MTGTDGLNKFVQTSPDVVILDIRLPDIDGFTVLEDIREDDEDAKVIMITAHHDMDTTISAMKEGAFDYIRKPINVDELEVSAKRSKPLRWKRRSTASSWNRPGSSRWAILSARGRR